MPDKQWIVYNGPDNEYDSFTTREEAEAHVRILIAEERESTSDCGLSDECDEYYVLHIVGRAKLTILKKREEQTIEDGYDQDGQRWDDDWDYIYNLDYVPNQEVP